MGIRSEQEYVVVAVVATAAEAEFVRMSLVVQGIEATSSVPDPAHPSLDFVQGVSVLVPADEEEAARAFLGGLDSST